MFSFPYLGTAIAANADQMHDIKLRINKAMIRCGALRHVLDSNSLSVKLKIRLYIAAVVSVMTYGCETWVLSPQAMRTLNGANSRMLARFTGKTIPQEARAATASYNLIRGIRIRRLRYLGHILRSGTNRLVYQAVVTQRDMNIYGGLTMDAPPHTSMGHLRELAMDRATWRDHTKHIPTVYN